MFGAPILNTFLANLPSVSSREAYFGIYSSEEVKKMSVVKIITPNSFNVLGHPLPGGLYDPKLGPCDRMTACSTCGQQTLRCPGHIGHIELPLPVVNPLFHKKIFDILSMSCLSCNIILLPIHVKALLMCQLRILNAGFIVEAIHFESYFLFENNIASSKEGADLYLSFIQNELDSYIKSLAVVNCCEILDEVTAKSFKSYDVVSSEFFKVALSQVVKSDKCSLCNADIPKISSEKNKITFRKPKAGKSSKAESVYFTAAQIKSHIQNIWATEKEFVEEMIPVLKRSNCPISTDLMFMDTVLVTPATMRPCNVIRNSPVEHMTNYLYKSIINSCLMLRSILVFANCKDEKEVPAEITSIANRARGNTVEEKLQTAWLDLQYNVDILLLGKNVGGNSANILNGLKQLIEKKQGIIRMNMMGKRVNFAARSVITPDPNLDINEIGFPEPFAKVLTYPVPVTPWNVVELRELVKNGPNIHPGATAIISENGSMHRISDKSAVERESLANRLLTPEETAKGGKIVLRHLMNGDVLLANRQPTLHKPSIMAHKARILKGQKTLRLHYANCKAYNADFDGDEMNTHFAQNEVARSEAYNIVNVTKQYLVPKDGTPLSGLIQDHVISGVQLSLRGKFFDKETYMHLVYQALAFKREPIKILPPAFIKPQRLWAGKQVISTIILNLTPKDKFPLNLDSSAKIPVKAWGSLKFNESILKNPKAMTESEVIIRNGHLLCGVIDKNHCGATSFGLIHSFHELYGGEASSRLLSSLSKLFTFYLQVEGFTLDVKDILVKLKPDQKRQDIIKEVRNVGRLAATAALNLPPETDLDDINRGLEKAYRTNPKFTAIIDREYKTKLDAFTNSINSTCLPRGLLEEFPRNNLQLMVQSGAKGSTVNTMQISCLLGQIELEGKRPPLMASGRSLPSFRPFDISPRAGGFIDGRFMTGIQPQEFFFHCMAGREGLIDTAVKTSRSGYLQRCLIKHLEGLVVNYDMTVRDSDGSVIQFLYGEDGLDVCKSQYFNPSLIQFLEKNIYSIVNKNSIKELKKQSEASPIKAHKKAIKSWIKKSIISGSKKQKPFLKFSQDAREELKSTASSKNAKKIGRSQLDLSICSKWQEMDEASKQKYYASEKYCPDPVISKYPPCSYFGSISEKLEAVMEDFLDKNPLMSGKKEKCVKEMINYKSMISICEPGEPVGVLAAQSVGEPSTQMTLNTFHFAGRGEMNVTLGVPRLRELLTIATKNVKTPCVDVPFAPCETPKQLNKRADKLRKRMMRVTMADVLEYINVTEKLDLKPHRHLTYKLFMRFLPRKAYKHLTNVKPDDILKHVDKHFLKMISSRITRHSASKSTLLHETAEKTTKTLNLDEDAEDVNEETSNVVGRKRLDLDSDSSGESEGEGEEEDATLSRKKSQRQGDSQYDEAEEDEKEVNIDDDEDIQEIKYAEALEIEEQDSEFTEHKKAGYVHNFKYDSTDGLWCNVELWLPLEMQHVDFSSLIKKCAALSVIYEVPNIKRAITYENNDRFFLKTDGINMNEMFSYSDVLDLNKLYCNDIHRIACTYGIEAAAKVIVKEVQNVFQVYGITVNPRHLILIADYMTFDGTYSALNRIGIEKNPSPFQQMSFECSLSFLKNSAIQGKADLLQSPSSRLFVGKHCPLGTGLMDILINS